MDGLEVGVGLLIKCALATLGILIACLLIVLGFIAISSSRDPEQSRIRSNTTESTSSSIGE